MPVLADGDLTLYDSTVILEYLEDAYPEPALYPQDPSARARCRLLELEAGEILLAPVRTLMFRTEPPGDVGLRARQEAEAVKAEPIIEANNRRLDAKLAGREFLCGTFSVADIATFMMVHYVIRLGGPALGSFSNLTQWYDGLLRRPAFAAAAAEIAEADRQLSHPVARC